MTNVFVNIILILLALILLLAFLLILVLFAETVHDAISEWVERRRSR